jgi:DNA primase large subunit
MCRYESEYLQVMGRDTFEKKRYVYSIRHLYGLEGKRHDRDPYSCHQITKDHESKCPFVGWTDGAATSLVRSLRPDLEEPQMAAILDHKRAGQARVACGLTLSRPAPATDAAGTAPKPAVFESPNAYYEAAVYVSVGGH